MLRNFATLALLWGMSSIHLLGCSCNVYDVGRPCDLLKSTNEVIFVGTLLSSENPPDPSKWGMGQARYTFQVNEWFSAATVDKVDVYSGRGVADCSVRFEIGKKYLVDGERGQDGHVSAWICSQTRQFRESDPLLPQLRAIRDGKKVDSLFGGLRRTQEPYGGASDPKFDSPLGGRDIRLNSGERRYETKTDSNGNYRFSSLPAGEYSVTADLPPNLVLTEPILDTLYAIKVAANACGEYDLKALPTGRIFGSVVGPDGTNVSGSSVAPVVLFRADRYTANEHGWEDSGWSNFLDDRGNFWFYHVAPGDYILLYNYNNLSRTRYPLTFYPSAQDVQHASKIHVDEGQEVRLVIRVKDATSHQ